MKHLGYIQKLGKLADKSIEFRSDSGTQERNRFWAIQREIIHLVGPEGREVQEWLSRTCTLLVHDAVIL